MKRLIVATCLLLTPCMTYAGWKVEPGKKVSALPGDRIGMVAKLPAKNSPKGVTAYLQVTCFDFAEHPEFTKRMLSLVMSKATAPGPLGWRYQIDESQPIQRGPHTRLSLTVTGLGDEELKSISSARRFRITVLPTTGDQWSFDFDVSGARAAIDAVPCRNAEHDKR